MCKSTNVCEVCYRPLTESDLEEDYTLSADCCGRIGLCAKCRKEGNHDCDTYPARGRTEATMKRLLEHCLEQIINDRACKYDTTEEQCWCYDEVDTAPDAGPPGCCLACRIREALGAHDGYHAAAGAIAEHLKLQAEIASSLGLSNLMTTGHLEMIPRELIYALLAAHARANEGGA